MKYLLSTIAVLFLTVVIVAENASAQVTYTSNKDGNWENNAIWNKDKSWAGDNPGTNLGGATSKVIVANYDTRNGNLTVGGSVTLEVSGILVIMGNMNAAGGSVIDIKDGGQLIILGDLNLGGGLNFDNTGTGVVAVGGDFKAAGGANVDTNNQFYLYDTTPKFNGGATVNGQSPSGNPAGEFQSATDLQNNHNDIYNFINSGGTTPLPIELVSFSASISNGLVEVKWETLTEKNFNHFELERSTGDLDHFSKIGTVMGVGESAQRQFYTFSDPHPVYGLSYYRLKSVDNDGSFEYSPIISVKISRGDAISLQQNPIKNNGTFKLSTPESFGDEVQLIELLSKEGRILWSESYASSKKVFALPAGASHGMYIVKVVQNGIFNHVRLIY